MTNEELDEARAREALRRWDEQGQRTFYCLAVFAARLAREGWKPPEPVDPDVLAFREWARKRWPEIQWRVDAGNWDGGTECVSFLAGVNYARGEKQ